MQVAFRLLKPDRFAVAASTDPRDQGGIEWAEPSLLLQTKARR
jgi:hypothetical protein